MDTLVYSKKIVQHDKLLPKQQQDILAAKTTFADIRKPAALGIGADDFIHMDYLDKEPLIQDIAAVRLEPENSSMIWIFENTKPPAALKDFLASHQLKFEELHQDSWHSMIPEVDNIVINLKEAPDRSLAMLQDPKAGEFLPQDAIDLAKQVLAARRINLVETPRQASR